jgi:hypothetical protein
MKNATQLHESGIVEFLEQQGCEALRYRKGTVIALRPARSGGTYRVSVELYEDEAAADPTRRFRARAARRFGLPVSARYGATPDEALANVQWRVLDSFSLPAPRPIIAGLL